MKRILKGILGVVLLTVVALIYLSLIYSLIYIGIHGIAPQTNEAVGIGFSTVTIALLAVYEVSAILMGSEDEDGEED